ncbi:interleukin-1 receptor-like 1 [Takifugu flavidus]|uniref:interleukin-1 receptor-like 1 n=1 Tax=Takifugu flavidus TaxID=433684 RepID=UPI00254490A5|nr:interleukin-1 receptor-like 1 [Takifugu flavidus]
MAGAGWLATVVALLSAAFVGAHERTETYKVSVGHLFILKCRISQTNVTWSREGTHNQSLPPGVEARGGLLRFLPVQMEHNGSYTCQKRDETNLKMKFSVLVSREKCPEALETRIISQGRNGVLPCKLREIFQLNTTRIVQWMKDCHPVEREGKSISVTEGGVMWLSEASEEDAGTYTCLVDVSLDGRNYTAARSIQLVIKTGPPDTVFTELQVLYPQQAVVIVEVGMRAELKCSAHVGFMDDSELSIYWTFNSEHTEAYMEFNDSWRFDPERRQVTESTLSISKVRREFLNVPFRCFVVSPADKKVGLLYLQEADRRGLHITVALCLSAFLTALGLAAAFQFCRTELTLAYRNLSGHLNKPAPEGKLYDAYVSYLHPSSRSSQSALFALQILPEKLERQHGYTLYIRGRDDIPGEAVHDTIATVIRQCQRLILILSTEEEFGTDGNEKGDLLCDQSQLCYEQSISLYDALLLNDPKVILVEFGLVDYSGLPESLRYIRRKQGSLTWRKASAGAPSLRKMYLNRNFWKDLRCHMPSVRVRKPQIEV